MLPPSDSEEEGDVNDDGNDDGADNNAALPDYGDPQFWHDVYTGARSRDEAPVEWLVTYEHFKAQGWGRFLPPAGGAILDLGCGDSEFMSEAYDDGFPSITCAD